jgi:ferric-dicitrate binding protein FerR (iron transport regulator)
MPIFSLHAAHYSLRTSTLHVRILTLHYAELEHVRAAWNSFTRVTALPPRPSAAADILSARRRSTGYIRVAVASAPAVMGANSFTDMFALALLYYVPP